MTFTAHEARKKRPLRNHSCTKIFLKELEERNGRFFLHDKPILHVQIMGNFQYVEHKGVHSEYYVDDGTATIMCVEFHADQRNAHVEPRVRDKTQRNDDQETFHNFVTRITEKRVLKFYDLVTVRGRIHKYRDVWQIEVSAIMYVSDINQHWFYIESLLNVRKKEREEKKKLQELKEK